MAFGRRRRDLVQLTVYVRPEQAERLEALATDWMIDCRDDREDWRPSEVAREALIAGLDALQGLR